MRMNSLNHKAMRDSIRDTGSHIFSESFFNASNSADTVQLDRSEWKYRISSSEREILSHRVSVLLDPDENQIDDQGYAIRSLYFDDVFDSFARGNEGGDSVRYKYRIRYYNDDYSFMKLERKMNYYGLCRKETSILDLEDYVSIINGDFGTVFWKTRDPLIRKFCAEAMSKPLIPKAIVEYRRIAFFDPFLNIRITFDSSIMASGDTDRFTAGDYYRYPLLAENEEILEVKFDSILPEHIKSFVTTGHLIPVAFSKYYLSRMRLRSLGVY